MALNGRQIVLVAGEKSELPKMEEVLPDVAALH